MANIYLASSRAGFGAGKRVVVKEILPKLSSDSRFVNMLQAEAKLAAELSHANIVQVFDLGKSDDSLYIAMEYVEGFDLHKLLGRLAKQGLGLSLEFSLFVVRELLSALDYAHRASSESGRALGVVHRDVSPANVLVSLDGEVKLCDFGIARALFDSDKADGPDVVMAGKAAYMSPEQAEGKKVGPRSDLFAVGIILWELCAGRRLYRGSDEQMLELAKQADIPPLPQRHLPEIDMLETVINRATAKDISERFENAAEMRDALDDYMRASQQIPSQLKFGAFMMDRFGDNMISQRRELERSSETLLDDSSVSLTSSELEAALIESSTEASVTESVAQDVVEDAADSELVTVAFAGKKMATKKAVGLFVGVALIAALLTTIILSLTR